MRKIIIVLLASLSLSSCSLFRTKIPPYPTGVFFPVEKAGEIIYEGEIIDSVGNVGENLYLATRRGFVYCLDGVERKISWRFKAAEPLASPPFFGPERIYVYDQNNILYCLDKEGKALWTKKVEEQITSGVGELNRKVYLGNERGIVFALSADDGHELWRFQTGGAIRATPVFADGKIILNCDDLNLYILTEEGNLAGQIPVRDKIQATPLVEENFLYFGAADRYFYCYNLKKRTMKWKIKIGGKVFTDPVMEGKRIFFVCWNNVLYCLRKKNGHILWWQIIPSRSTYRLEISGGRIVVSSLSSLLVCFDAETGEKAGDYDAGDEVKSNPLWVAPHLVICLYDDQKDSGKVVFLKKVIRISLKSSLESPQAVGKEISFTASAAGFYKPKYGFYLKAGDEKKVIQEKSERSTCVWFPEKEGNYVIGVEISDEKQSMQKETAFVIKK